MNLPAARPNLFLQGLQQRQTACQWGLWCSIPSPVTAELCAGAGFDWLLFDMEHSPADVKDIYAALQAASAYAVSPIVRPPSNDPVAIKRLLDIGVQNLLVPFVQNAEEARMAVAAATYPPDGIRGLTMTSRANAFGRFPGYVNDAAGRIGIVLQIETHTALQNLEAIAMTPGVTAVFLGPSDLSADMGYIGRPDAPEVREAILRAAERLRQLEKPWGILCSTDAAPAYASAGAAFVAAGSDLGLLRASSDALATHLKAMVSKMPQGAS